MQQRRQRYVVNVRANFRVALRRTAAASKAAAAQAPFPAGVGQSVRWREGSKGWRRARCVALRWGRVDGAGPRCRGWLIGPRPGRGQEGEPKFYWSNCGPQASLAQMVADAHRRWWIEQYHEEAKGLLGWDQYPGRLWPGFHRHAVTVSLAYSFLVWLEGQQRQGPSRPGRSRRACSPSAGPEVPVAAGGAPPGNRLAAA